MVMWCGCTVVTRCGYAVVTRCDYVVWLCGGHTVWLCGVVIAVVTRLCGGYTTFFVEAVGLEETSLALEARLFYHVLQSAKGALLEHDALADLPCGEGVCATHACMRPS